jgi:hypothetical protein
MIETVLGVCGIHLCNQRERTFVKVMQLPLPFSFFCFFFRFRFSPSCAFRATSHRLALGINHSALHVPVDGGIPIPKGIGFGHRIRARDPLRRFRFSCERLVYSFAPSLPTTSPSLLSFPFQLPTVPSLPFSLVVPICIYVCVYSTFKFVQNRLDVIGPSCF